MTDAALEIADETDSTWNQPDVVTFGDCIGGAKSSRSEEAASDTVSAHEISDLVFGALQDAMLAAPQPCPATYLDFLEGRKRDGMVARMNDLPVVQLSHPVVQAEVLNEFVMMRAQRKLANGIVEGIRNYARSKRRALMAAMN